MSLALKAWKIILWAVVLCLFCYGFAAHAETALSLTSPQQAQIWRSLRREARRTSVPAGLHVGEAVPDTMRLLPFRHRLRTRIPGLKSYSYALLNGQVLI